MDQPIIYVMIASEADLQELKRDIAKRVHPLVFAFCSNLLDFQFMKILIGKL